MKLDNVITRCLFGVIVLLSGCAYYSTTGSYLPAHIQTITIPMFGNRALEHGLAEQLTDELQDRFDANSRLKVVNQGGDSVLEGEIISIDDEPFTIGGDETARQYRLSIIVSVTYRDVKENEVIWQSASLEGWDTYEISGVTDRSTALENALEKLATDIVNQTLSGW